MLTVKLSPVRSDREPLVASWIAPVLIVNGVEYDLSELPDGATAEHDVLGTVERTGDDYEVTLMLPHGPNAPYETRFPVPIVMNTDGQLNIPAWTEVL